jgi:CheY-like chemotaxis protein
MEMRVLIVDDNASFLHAASSLLEREGLAVAGVASTSAEGLSAAETLRPDVVLVDVFLGPESGFELARRLAAAGWTVVLISTHDELTLRELIATSPASGFLSKADLSASELRRVVQGRDGA